MASAQPAAVPIRAATIRCTSSNEASPSSSPVPAKEPMSRASNHSGAPCIQSRWMKSVMMYGALGRKSSHTTPTGASSHPGARSRSSPVIASARRKGIHARKRFQKRKVKTAPV
ncbi:hypothetical protein B277_13064 [Janibacter hoylei PVAS-1]|uniref:Uncharacterized protein n=1 Tax=Janibacter hoylei PVAS-1 TaxID=1210046 RepID=K1EMA7_9MICO|nr:hypothetical protein [Janibacter hoylei]EKA60413.1 hypothetical protein B277_13064 [Janibacter hoylei PVAS-1]